MKPFLDPFLMAGLGIELIYSFVIIACSLMVYYGTKELYELSSYKGINYFRRAFLFFAVAYAFRSFIKFILIYFGLGRIFDFSPRFFGPFTLMVFMYLSAMAVFYLLYSVMWKKWGNKTKRIYLFHILAVVIAILSVISRSFYLHIGMNIFLFAFVAFIFYTAHRDSKDKKKGHNLYTIYMLLFFFWILNIIDILIPKFSQTIQLVIYLMSSGIFLMILYRVLKKTGPN